MAYSFLSSWAMESLYPNLIAPANTGTASNHHMSAFLQFDLTPLIVEALAGDDIISATMRLYVLSGAESGFGAGPSATYPVSFDVRLLEGSWNEATLTWNNQPGGAYNPTTTSPPGTIVATSPTITNTGIWVDVDITDILTGWLDDPATNYGLRLTQPTEVRDSGGASVFPSFASSEYATESYRPQLVVQTVPEPETAVLFGLGVAGFLTVRRRNR
ncbi:DNRLRE domain-containing protein [Roseimicrobium sp. ORNL1]|uniref:PEP-CTERM sorting domain-containing protein n=1 Tax=Roseimicrobium sp. ORNL1 TaxID=2711231 RepID=UPI0013E1E475|nr:DNRLRE domain-containing protein [Roseimicrobium sp. ORNL1]QIF01664.1 PEP-CTERM sorting domain-containing protein [Roseimicrobium sp. ORNL1]